MIERKFKENSKKKKHRGALFLFEMKGCRYLHLRNIRKKKNLHLFTRQPVRRPFIISSMSRSRDWRRLQGRQKMILKLCKTVIIIWNSLKIQGVWWNFETVEFFIDSRYKWYHSRWNTEKFFQMVNIFFLNFFNVIEKNNLNRIQKTKIENRILHSFAGQDLFREKLNII